MASELRFIKPRFTHAQPRSELLELQQREHTDLGRLWLLGVGLYEAPADPRWKAYLSDYPTPDPDTYFPQWSAAQRQQATVYENVTDGTALDDPPQWHHLATLNDRTARRCAFAVTDWVRLLRHAEKKGAYAAALSLLHLSLHERGKATRSDWPEARLLGTHAQWITDACLPPAAATLEQKLLGSEADARPGRLRQAFRHAFVTTLQNSVDVQPASALTLLIPDPGLSHNTLPPA